MRRMRIGTDFVEMMPGKHEIPGTSGARTFENSKDMFPGGVQLFDGWKSVGQRPTARSTFVLFQQIHNASSFDLISRIYRCRSLWQESQVIAFVSIPEFRELIFGTGEGRILFELSGRSVAHVSMLSVGLQLEVRSLDDKEILKADAVKRFIAIRTNRTFFS